MSEGDARVKKKRCVGRTLVVRPTHTRYPGLGMESPQPVSQPVDSAQQTTPENLGGPGFRWRPDRVQALINVKKDEIGRQLGRDLVRADLYAQGFRKGWIDRKRKPDEPLASEGAKVAQWLDVPLEYLVGAAPEYDNMDAWEVASRASLDLFLKRHPERADAAQFREALEDHFKVHRMQAPRTIAGWAVVYDAMARGHRQAIATHSGLDQPLAGGGP